MDDLVREVIPLLQYLIPGFLAAWIFYSLTASDEEKLGDLQSP